METADDECGVRIQYAAGVDIIGVMVHSGALVPGGNGEEDGVQPQAPGGGVEGIQ